MFLIDFGYDNNHGMLSNVIASYMANNTFSHRQDVAFATVTAIRWFGWTRFSFGVGVERFLFFLFLTILPACAFAPIWNLQSIAKHHQNKLKYIWRT